MFSRLFDSCAYHEAYVYGRPAEAPVGAGANSTSLYSVVFRSWVAGVFLNLNSTAGTPSTSETAAAPESGAAAARPPAPVARGALRAPKRCPASKRAR